MRSEPPFLEIIHDPPPSSHLHPQIATAGDDRHEIVLINIKKKKNYNYRRTEEDGVRARDSSRPSSQPPRAQHLRVQGERPSPPRVRRGRDIEAPVIFNSLRVHIFHTYIYIYIHV